MLVQLSKKTNNFCMWWKWSTKEYFGILIQERISKICNGSLGMDDVRAQITGLHQQKVHQQQKPLIYFDFAATTHVPQCVTDAVVEAYDNQTWKRPSQCSLKRISSHRVYENSRNQMAGFLGCSPSDCFTSGTTAGLNLIAHCAGEQLNKGDVVVLSVMEHHAHLVPWQMVANPRVGNQNRSCR